MGRGFSTLLPWAIGRVEKEKSMPFLVQLGSLWFRTTSSHCRACKRSVLQSPPFSSFLSLSGPAQAARWQGITLCFKEKKEWGKKTLFLTGCSEIYCHKSWVFRWSCHRDGERAVSFNESFYLDVRTTVVFLPFSKKFTLLDTSLWNFCNTYLGAWSHSG